MAYGAVVKPAGKAVRVLICLAFCGCQAIQPATSLSPSSQLPGDTPVGRPATSVAFMGVVCCDYRSGKRLQGWLNTRTVIQKTLDGWYHGLEATQKITDPSRKLLEHKLKDAQNMARQTELLIVYLGVRQTSDGDCILTNGEVVSWTSVFPEAPPPPAERSRTFYILDACHAAATLENYPELRQYGTWLAGASKDGLVFQRNVTVRRGYDVERRHPKSWTLLHTMLESRPLLLSHTGLVWITALESSPVTSPSTPRTFLTFLNHCAHTGRRIAATSTFRGTTVPIILK